jgi:cellulose biosynthesis protein BcsQ
MAKVIAIAQRKGGTGKTTLAVSLAAAASCGTVAKLQRSRSSKPLQSCNAPILVDVDSQANATTWALGAPARDTLARLQSVAMLAWPPAVSYLPPTSPLRAVRSREELLEAVLPDVLRESVVPGLRVVGSTPLVHPEDTDEIVLRSLPGDVVIVDTGADTSTPIARSVLVQADVVLIPAVPEPWSVDGIGEVIEECRSVGRSDLYYENRIRVVVTRRERNRVHDVLEGSLRERLGELVSRTVIPKSAAIALASHKAENLTPSHPLRKLAAAILRECLDIATGKEAAA